MDPNANVDDLQKGYGTRLAWAEARLDRYFCSWSSLVSLAVAAAATAAAFDTLFFS
jgi:hypothetical protein